MNIVYTDHLKTRLLLRRIDTELPKIVFEKAPERYYDVNTGHSVAVMRTALYGRVREVMIAYVSQGEETRILTIHPLKDGQKEGRIESGRWREI